MIRNTSTLSLLLVALLLVGCSRGTSLETGYGDSHGRSGYNSINGFGALRESFHDAGWESRTLSRLGERMLRLDAMVWTPSDSTGIRGAETAWFEDWLSSGNKTLIYVIYDGGSEADYWRNAIPFAPPGQRFEYRRREARAQIERERLLTTRYVLPDNGWFQAAPLPYPQPVTQTFGAWATAEETHQGELADPDTGPAIPRAPIPGVATGELQVLVRVGNFQRSTVQPGNATKPAGTASQATNGPVQVDPVQVDPGANITEENLSSSTTKTKLRAVLANEQETPLVTRIRSPDWKQSQIFIVSGGSLLNNYGLTTKAGREISTKLLAASGPPGEVGFLLSDASGVRISDSFSDADRKTGMELLTVWPLGLVTIHLLMIGIIICFILFPIFGRPRQQEKPSQNDFADHIDAIANLMKRMDSDDYAKQRISEYMRRVRGETRGPWLLPEPPRRETEPQRSAERGPNTGGDPPSGSPPIPS